MIGFGKKPKRNQTCCCHSKKSESSSFFEIRMKASDDRGGGGGVNCSGFLTLMTIEVLDDMLIYKVRRKKDRKRKLNLSLL